MTKEVLGLIKKMDVNSAQLQLALRCAPLLAGIKPSNLLVVQDAEAQRIRSAAEHTEIAGCRLAQSGRKTILLLYRRRMLGRHLENKKVRELLHEAGYRTFAFDALLKEAGARYAAYMRGEAGFPHEMGLFLGYPPEDVEGFIKNNGKNFLCSGYWKVYADKEIKLRLFHYFDRAEELLLHFLAQGICMDEILSICSSSGSVY